jgi:hypothetical protein
LVTWIVCVLPALLLSLHVEGITPLKWEGGTLHSIRAAEGLAYAAPLQHEVSILEPVLYLYEDGARIPLPPARTLQFVSKHGRGAYYFDPPLLFFSSTDNTDPRGNGHIYTFEKPSTPPTWLAPLLWLLAGVATLVLSMRHYRALSQWIRRRRFALSLCVLLVLAAANRTWMLSDLAIPAVHPDSGSYFSLSERLTGDEWPHFGVRPPVYPLFLASVFAAKNSLMALVWAQNLLSVAAAASLLYAAYLMCPGATPFIAVALGAFLSSNAALEHDTAMLSESVYASGLQISFASLAIGLVSSSPRWLALASTAFALTILTRPAGMFLIVIFLLVVTFAWWNRAPRRAIAAFALPMPALLLSMCLYNWSTIGVFNVTAWGEANLAGATFSYWQTDPTYPEHVNAGIVRIRDMIRHQLRAVGADEAVLDSSWDPNQLNQVFVWGWDHGAIAVAMAMGSSDIEGRQWIRRIAFDSIAKRPDIYAKFVMSMLYNYFRAWPEYDFRSYLRQRAGVLYIERRFSSEQGNPILTRMAKDFADAGPPPTVFVPRQDHGLSTTEKVLIAPTATWRLYALTDWLRTKYFNHTGWAIGAALALVWSVVALISSRGTHTVAFCVLIICLGVIGASLVVSLVEYSQPRYSYPMEWAYAYTVAITSVFVMTAVRAPVAKRVRAAMHDLAVPVLDWRSMATALGPAAMTSVTLTAFLLFAAYALRTGVWQTPWQRLTLQEFAPELGFAYQARLPHDVWSAEGGPSVARVFENGRELGPANALHADIRTVGHGQYSFWGDWVYVSASDNTDPRTNRRTYEAYGPNPLAATVRRSAYVFALISALLTMKLTVPRLRRISSSRRG